MKNNKVLRSPSPRPSPPGEGVQKCSSHVDSAGSCPKPIEFQSSEKPIEFNLDGKQFSLPMNPPVAADVRRRKLACQTKSAYPRRRNADLLIGSMLAAFPPSRSGDRRSGVVAAMSGCRPRRFSSRRRLLVQGFNARKNFRGNLSSGERAGIRTNHTNI